MHTCRCSRERENGNEYVLQKGTQEENGIKCGANGSKLQEQLNSTRCDAIVNVI